MFNCINCYNLILICSFYLNLCSQRQIALVIENVCVLRKSFSVLLDVTHSDRCYDDLSVAGLCLFALILLANVTSRSRSLYAVARPSVVCNVRASYSDG